MSTEMKSLECEVCTEYFDEANHLPRCLTCGHTLCTSCISSILQDFSPLRCPFCRKQHRIPVYVPEELPVNYSIISIINSKHKLSDKVPSQANSEDWFNSLKQDINKSTDVLYSDLENELNNLERLQKKLDSKQRGHKRLSDRIPEYIRHLKNVGDDIAKERLATKKAIKEGHAKRDEIRQSRRKLEGSKTLFEMSEAHQSIVSCHTDIQEWRAGTRPLQYSDVFKNYKALKRVTVEALSLIPVTKEEIFAKEMKDGSRFLLYLFIVLFVIIGVWIEISLK